MSYRIIGRGVYKKIWKVNLKNPYVVLKEKPGAHFVPRKTFKTKKAARVWIRQQRR